MNSAAVERDLLRFRLEVATGMTISILSAVCIVLLNKSLFDVHGFVYPVTLTGWHMCFTTLTLRAAVILGVFQHKRMPLRSIIGFSLLDSITMGLQNLSLGNNSVSFYQMCKLLVAPVTVFLQRVFFGERLPSPAVMMALIVLLVGVGLATVSDVQLKPLGILFGLASTILVCFVSIFTSSLQQQYDISPFQMLHNVAPFEGLILLLIGPIWDTSVVGKNPYLDHTWSVESLCTVFGTCVLAVLVNCATFFLLGKTSPVSYQVMGHLKTALVLGGGFLFFDGDESSKAGTFGVLIAFAGCMLYGYLKDSEVRKSLQRTCEPEE